MEEANVKSQRQVDVKPERKSRDQSNITQQRVGVRN